MHTKRLGKCMEKSWRGCLEQFWWGFQNTDELYGLFYSTCRDLEMNMFLRIHAVQELYQRDRY